MPDKQLMPDDDLGPWTVETIDGSHVEWRQRATRASEAIVSAGGKQVVDISVDGAPPVTQVDLNKSVDTAAELKMRVAGIKNG